MNNTIIPCYGSRIAQKWAKSKHQPSTKEQLLSYYEEAGPDYEVWSPNFNMHFGYYSKGMNPFNREAMLENMNNEILDRLEITDKDRQLVDMGCGLGATLRHAAQKVPHLDLKGVTLVPWQVEQANQLNETSGQAGRIEILNTDYCRTGIPANSTDLVVAIESGCYAGGASKSDLLAEVYRILKPGGRFIMSDGFVKGDRPMSAFLRSVYRQLCNSWALTELGHISAVTRSMRDMGFKAVDADDISWKVAPSVAHVPFVVISFLFKELFFGRRKMTRERWDNLKSPLLTMITGLSQQHFGYYLVSGRK